MNLKSMPLGLVSLLLFSCGSPEAEEELTGNDPENALPLPEVALEDVPAPPNATVIIEQGSNIGEIASQAYGHERFSGFVMEINGLSDPTRVQANSEIKTPSIAVGFQIHGIDERYQPAVNVLAKASADFYAVLPAYLEARSASGGSDIGQIEISPELSNRLTGCADAIDAAMPALSEPAPGHQAPKKTVAKFRTASDLIRNLAAGYVDGIGYDYDQVGQSLGFGFTYAIIWVKAGHQ